MIWYYKLYWNYSTAERGNLWEEEAEVPLTEEGVIQEDIHLEDAQEEADQEGTDREAVIPEVWEAAGREAREEDLFHRPDHRDLPEDIGDTEGAEDIEEEEAALAT